MHLPHEDLGGVGGGDPLAAGAGGGGGGADRVAGAQLPGDGLSEEQVAMLESSVTRVLPRLDPAEGTAPVDGRAQGAAADDPCAGIRRGSAGPVSRTGPAQELADGSGESLGRLDRTGMTDVVQDDQPRAGDGRVQGLGYGERCAHVLVTAQDQRRHGYQAEHRTQVRLGGGQGRRAEPDGVELPHRRRERGHSLWGCGSQEHAGEQRLDEVVRRQIRHIEAEPQAIGDRLGGTAIRPNRRRRPPG